MLERLYGKVQLIYCERSETRQRGNLIINTRQEAIGKEAIVNTEKAQGQQGTKKYRIQIRQFHNEYNARGNRQGGNCEYRKGTGARNMQCVAYLQNSPLRNSCINPTGTPFRYQSIPF